jgi:RimJ/RimL family protein N-acetyltransferase
MSQSATTHFVQPVVLRHNGVRLEPLERNHEAGLIAAAQDGELWNSRVTSVPAPDQAATYIDQALQMRADGNRFAFAVIDEASGKVLGSTSYHDIVGAIKRVEIGYTWYGKSAQKTHVNASCKWMMMSHAFETLGCNVVGWRTDNFNFASQQAILRLGAKLDGVIRGHAPRRDGTIRDTHIYSMRAGEWPEAKAELLHRMTKVRT